MIRITNLLKQFSGGGAAGAAAVRAVDDISFELPAGKVLTLLGPSGCGKTTTMRSVAGLEKPNSGTIEIGDQTVFSQEQGINLRPNQRRVGMVFQSYAIWPHMTVIQNVAYPLKGNVDKQTMRNRAMDALRLVGLDHLADRRAPNLSGGQQQRVALARALVAEPEVLLLDEPLSNLDAKLRDNMRQEIRELQQKLGITALYVTHDQSEALAISDLVAVMSNGKIIDFGEPERIYSRPNSREVAQFIGMANIIDVTGVHKDGTRWVGQSDLGQVAIDRPGELPDKCGLLVRLEDIEVLSNASERTENVWPGRITSALYLGAYFECVIEIGGRRIRTHMTRRARPRAGDNVIVHVPARSLHVLPELGIEIVDTDLESTAAAVS
jgi:iron(III) transport system ATP-binding protein